MVKASAMATGEAPTLVECVFVLSGRDFDPDACGRELGIEGTHNWRQTHEHLVHRTDLPNAEWGIGIGPDVFDEIDLPVRMVLERLASITSLIVDYAVRHKLSAGVSCKVKVYTQPPVYALSPDAMRSMAQLGAEFTMDIIDLRPDEDPPPDESDNGPSCP
jgi:hypothetical protein